MTRRRGPHQPGPHRPGPDTERRIIDDSRLVAQGGQTPDPALAAELDRLFASHRQQIYGLCLRMVGDPQRAEELTQETFTVAWRRLPEFRPEARFGTWIFSIARNLCRNARRKRRELLTDDGVLEPSDPSTDIYAQLRAEERAGLLRDAAAQLDPLEQEAVHMRYTLGLPYAEITRLLELPGSGARGLLQRCRRKLAAELRRRLDELGHGVSLFRASTP